MPAIPLLSIKPFQMPLVVVARDSAPGQGFVMLGINTASCAMDENRVLFSLIRVGVFYTITEVMSVILLERSTFQL